MKLLNKKIKRSFNLTQDLAEHLEESLLRLALPNLPSNTIGEQFWCMVGARESYLNAIKNGKWSGFACSLAVTTAKPAILAAFTKSQQDVMDFIIGATLNDTQNNFLLDLLEHEIQHHGQLIRFIYGNKLTFPKSWNQRYTV